MYFKQFFCHTYITVTVLVFKPHTTPKNCSTENVKLELTLKYTKMLI